MMPLKMATQTQFRYMSENLYAVENGTNFENRKTVGVPLIFVTSKAGAYHKLYPTETPNKSIGP